MLKLLYIRRITIKKEQMKKIKTINKLTLNKEFVSQLNEGNMKFIKGGELRIPSGCVCVWTTRKKDHETYGIRCVSEIAFPKIPMPDPATMKK